MPKRILRILASFGAMDLVPTHRGGRRHASVGDCRTLGLMTDDYRLSRAM